MYHKNTFACHTAGYIYSSFSIDSSSGMFLSFFSTFFYLIDTTEKQQIYFHSFFPGNLFIYLVDINEVSESLANRFGL